MPVINHVHTYIRYKSRPGFYRCNSPDCTHFIDKESILGKLSLCTECGNQMILTREDLRRARPKCLNCSQTKKAKEWRKVQDLTRYLGTESFNPLGTLNLKHSELTDEELEETIKKEDENIQTFDWEGNTSLEEEQEEEKNE